MEKTNTPATKAKADICIYGTGHVGTNVAKCLVKQQSKGRSLTLLLAGRNVDKIEAQRDELLTEFEHEKVNICIDCYKESVNLNDDNALLTLANQTRVIINCVDVDCHPRALVGVAEACILAGTHYLDLAPRYSHLKPLLDLNVSCDRDESSSMSSILVPSSGFDYCLFDLAILQAEREFQLRYPGTKPNRVRATMAVRTGPQGFKWPLKLIKGAMNSEKVAVAKSPRSIIQETPAKRSAGTFLSFCNPLSSWSIRLPMGANAVAFLLSQRGWPEEFVDVRLALPKSLWKALLMLLYGMAMVVLFLPLMAIAKYTGLAVLQRLNLWLLPKLVPLFSDDYEECQRSREDMTVELLVVVELKSEEMKRLKKRRPQQQLPFLCYHIKGPSPEVLNPLCLSLTALELLDNTASTCMKKDRRCGVLTPAIAMGHTDLWDKLCTACHLEISVCTVE